MDELIITKGDFKRLMKSLEGIRKTIESRKVSNPLVQNNPRAKADLNHRLGGFDEAVEVVKSFRRGFDD